MTNAKVSTILRFIRTQLLVILRWLVSQLEREEDLTKLEESADELAAEAALQIKDLLRASRVWIKDQTPRVQQKLQQLGNIEFWEGKKNAIYELVEASKEKVASLK